MEPFRMTAHTSSFEPSNNTAMNLEATPVKGCRIDPASDCTSLICKGVRIGVDTRRSVHCQPSMAQLVAMKWIMRYAEKPMGTDHVNQALS